MNCVKTILAGACATAFMMPGLAQAEIGSTLAGVKERGALSCTGHNGSYLGLAEVDDQGNWQGFDIDLCRAMSTAIFGTDEGHLSIQPTSWAQRWPSIQSGELDIIIKSSGWTFSRDTDIGMQFSRPYLMASINYMASADTGAKSAADLDGGTLCVQTGTTTERNAIEHAASNGYEIEVVPFEKTEEAKAAFLSGRCDAYIEWDLQLAVMRATEIENPDDYVILPESLSAEPVAMVMRQGDDNWVDIANWLLSALMIAEQSGVTSENVDDMKANPPTPRVAKLLGATPGFGAQLGLQDDWAYNVIKRHGNFDEIWQRNIGRGSSYGLERNVNALIRDGGIMFPLVLD
jgi:general L-amino acid transport system substrate-binding protein